VQGSATVTVGVPTVTTEHGRVVHRTPCTVDGRDREVRYEVDERWADLVSPLADAPLLAVVPLALARGATIRVTGPVTDELVHGLHHGFLHLHRRTSPRFGAVTVEATTTVAPSPPAAGVATGLTGGVDSWTVLVDHALDPTVPAGSRLTHLVNSDTLTGTSRETLHAMRGRMGPIADALGLPFVFVDSNLRDLQSESDLAPGGIVTGAQVSTAFLLQRGIGTYLYASTVAEEQVGTCEPNEMGRLDALTLPHLANGSVRIRSVGGEYRRIDKLRRIADVEGTWTALEVCTDEHLDGNCGRCRKCRRTLAALDVLGLLERYRAVFDLDEWSRVRTRTFRALQRSEHPHSREIVEAARAHGMHLPRPVPFPRLRRLVGATRHHRSG